MQVTIARMLAYTKHHNIMCRTAKRHYHPDERDDNSVSAAEQIPFIAKLMLQYGMSYECYHELTQVVEQLPRSYKVRVPIIVNITQLAGTLRKYIDLHICTSSAHLVHI